MISGLYRFAEAPESKSHRAQLLFSGSAMPAARKAAELLAEDWDVALDLWSAPGWVGLHRDAIAVDEWNRDHPTEDALQPVVTERLADVEGPVVAVSDYQRAVPQLIAPWVPGGLVTLGTDGFGQSGTRAALRRHFRIDAESIVAAVLWALAERGEVKREVVADALERYDLV